MCNNNGHCRKFDAGTMCPSFRVTRDEEHLTRGRANTLRLALSGQLGGGLESDAVRDALDLCVSCKGCRRECPTGVDMAKMKIEFLHHYHRRRGVSIKDRLISYLPRYAHWGARLPWLFNLRNTMPAATALSEKWFGFAAQRSLPSWRSDTFLAGLMYPINADGSIEPQSRGDGRRSRAVRRHIQQRLRARGCARCARGARSGRLHGAHCTASRRQPPSAVLWAHVSGDRPGRSSQG